MFQPAEVSMPGHAGTMKSTQLINLLLAAETIFRPDCLLTRDIFGMLQRQAPQQREDARRQQPLPARIAAGGQSAQDLQQQPRQRR